MQNCCVIEVMLRVLLVAVAHKNGLEASFLPKMFPDSAGSGCHIHMSIEKVLVIRHSLSRQYEMSVTCRMEWMCCKDPRRGR